MGTRLELQSKLEDLLGSENVYYQPPESKKIKYPAIVFSRSDFYIARANDAKYSQRKRYELIVVARKPDNEVIDKLLDLQYCSYDRQYVSDNLYHDVFTLYF